MPLTLHCPVQEPPRVLQPVRQCLGYVLLQQGKLTEAAQVYEEDLAEHPANGWSLKGLIMAKQQQDAADPSLDKLQAVFDATWAHADEPLDTSCPCFSESSGFSHIFG